MTFKLYITGGTNIERTTQHFDRLSEAVRHVELTSISPTGWKLRKGELVMTDLNNSERIEDVVVSIITKA